MKSFSNRLLVVVSMLALSISLPSRAAAEPTSLQTVSGIIEEMDSGRSLLTIMSFSKPMTFRLAADAVVAVANNSTGTLDDLKVGDQVEVSYDPMFTAHRVTQQAAVDAAPDVAPALEVAPMPGRVEKPPQEAE